jgi:hypothetical protein
MICVYWINPDIEGAYFRKFSETELAAVLRFCDQLRKDGNKFVTTASEPTEMVGQPGVDTVADGKLPNGEPYEWTKDRAGKMRSADYTKIHRNDN